MTPRAVGFLGTGVVAEIEDVDLEKNIYIYIYMYLQQDSALISCLCLIRMD